MAGRAVHVAGASVDAAARVDDPLSPYVPRLAVDWLHDEPGCRIRTVPGTHVFADISGFTALTERLSANGRVGGEEMGDLLNGAFDQLLTAAYDFGASLIKWGGDAVLLLFDGPDHVLRAANAALGMQSVMRRIGRLQTSRGIVRLGMSIGVHTGDMDVLLVGTEHRELVVTGPTATTTAAMEKIAERGQVVVSAATAAALPGGCVGAAAGEGFLLTGAPPVAPTPNRRTKRSGVDLATAMCSDLAQHLHSDVSEHEHRFVTAGFIRFTGSDSLLAEHGPDALADAVGHLIDQVQQAAVANGVTFLATDISEDGGKVFLVAGAPYSRGDDETRMLATMRRVVHTGGRLELHAGVTCGGVFAGDFGPFYRRTYSLAGDTVNLAARLAGYARPGQIVTTPQVIQRSRTAWETTALPPFMVKGKARPIDAVLVGDVRRAAEPRGEARLPLVGRDAELDLLLDAARSARNGAGRVIDLLGPAGIGKSRLIEELASRADLQTLWADGDIYGRATPYQPMQRLLRTTLGLPADVDQATMAAVLHELVVGTGPDLLPWLPLIGIAAGVDLPSTPEVDQLDPDVRRARLGAVTSTLLGRLLRGPILMVINDLHFMDEATVDLVRRLVDDAAERRWLIVVTRRDAEQGELSPGEHVRALELAPLDVSASLDLIATAARSVTLPEHRVRTLVERAGGNPLFLTHLLAAAADTDDDALPDTIEGVLSAQIDRLPTPRRRWLRAAAVLGMTVDPDLLSAVLAGTDLEDAGWGDLGDFITRSGDGRLQFTHHLVRLSAYGGLPYRRRVELHARTADILERRGEGTESADLLSLHCLEGAQYDRAWRYSRIAGDRARALYAPAEAVACYRRALTAAPRVADLANADLADVFEQLAETYMDLGEMDAAERALRQARMRSKGDLHRSARLQLATARQRHHCGRHADALRWVARGRSQLSTCTDTRARTLQAMLAERGAQIRYDQGAYTAALVWARRASDEAREAGDVVTESHALATTLVLSAAAGLAVDEVSMRQAMALYEQIDDYRGKFRAANMFGMTAYFAGNWDAAVAFYAEAEQAARRVGRDHDAALIAVNRAEVLVQQGRVNEAEPVVANAVRVLVGARATSFLSFATTIYALVAIGKGDYLAAMDRLVEARELCVEMGETDDALRVDSLIAETLLRSGAREDALSHAEIALAQAAAVNGEVTAEPALHRTYGEALLPHERSRGEAALRRSLDCARKRGAQNEIEQSLEALLRAGVAADEAEALAWHTESAELARTLGIVTARAGDTVLFPQTAVVGGGGRPPPPLLRELLPQTNFGSPAGAVTT